ncbi:hypothetical protein BDV18DRAFT_129428 [Aspergillus unguis]
MSLRIAVAEMSLRRHQNYCRFLTREKSTRVIVGVRCSGEHSTSARGPRRRIGACSK